MPSAHWRFTESGSLAYSDAPRSNKLTDFAIALVRRIRSESLSPQDAALAIAQAPEFIRRSFSPQTIAQWSSLPDTLGAWPTAHASSSLAEFIRSLGATYPWHNPEAWRSQSSLDRRRRGLPDLEPHPANLATMLYKPPSIPA